ncbi:MAG: nucleotidyltransferase domain-containing protein [Candidatus Woesearchaeota archaeon]|nr:nucleotidyltransferase domain-containing protein [Candidatus Woesearchaeota archaeon]
MTTLLKSGFEKILRAFYRHRNASIHLRELARQTNLHGQSIVRYLRLLEKERYLRSVKEGNQRKYLLVSDRHVFGVLAIFDIEREQKLPVLRQQAIQAYLENLPTPPTFAILFGSTAKETYTNQSDIDILLITTSKIDSKKAEFEAGALYAQKVSTFQMTYKMFKKELKLKEEPVIQSAINTGYPLINHVLFYEELTHAGI